MSIDPEDPHCPECGEPIGQTATYCMHCSADLTEERAAADADGDGTWDGTTASDGTSNGTASASGEPGGDITTADEQLLDPDGLVDNTLTAVVGIVAGLVVGVVGTSVLLALTGNAWALLFGLCAWLGSTVYLARRRTVQDAISKGGYATAAVLLVVPLVALSPFMDVEGGLGERGSTFLVLFVFVAVPAGIAAVIGWVASRFTSAGDAGAR